MVADQHPSFAYSVGLAEKNCPELFVFGLREAIATSLITNVGLDLIAGKQLETGKRYDEYLVGYLMYVRPVSANGAYARYASPGDFPVLQIVWCDQYGHFPGEPDYDADPQPML
jgi:hypothetical protein